MLLVSISYAAELYSTDYELYSTDYELNCTVLTMN